MERLIFPALLINSIREAVLQEDGHEWFAFGLCGRSGDRFLMTDIRSIAEKDHIMKARGGCRVDPEIELEFLDECVGQKSRIPLLIHSHPFHSGPGVGFSSLDAEMMKSMTQWLQNAYPKRGEGPLFAVVGQDSIRVARYEESENGSRLSNVVELPVEVIGEWKLERQLSRTEPTSAAQERIETNRDRHDRTIRALTADGQIDLVEARVGIVSAGGIGSLLVEQLARLGVGELVVVDPDAVEASNLNRLYGATHDDVGRDKVAVMKCHAESINPNLNVEVYATPAQDNPDVLQTCDLLVAGVDQISARMWLNEFAVRHLIPYVDAGTIIGMDDATDKVTEMEGIVQTIVPGVTGCFACLDRGDPEQARIERLSDAELEAEVADGYVEESVLTPEPAVVHLNSLVASKAVDVVVKLLTGFDNPTGLVRYEGLGNQLDAFRTQPAENCQVCDSGHLLGTGTPAHETMSADEIAAQPATDELDQEMAAKAADTVDVEMGVDDEKLSAEDNESASGDTRGPVSKLIKYIVPALNISHGPGPHDHFGSNRSSESEPPARDSSDEEVSNDGR